jgi:hypothetical protein
MNPEFFTIGFAVFFGLALSIFKFPSHKLIEKIEPSQAFLYRFVIGLVFGLSIYPLLGETQKYVIGFVATQPDFVVAKAQKLILGLFGILGFVAGMRMGKKKA